MPQFDVLAIGELNPDLILSGIKAGQPRLGTEQSFSELKLTLGSSTAIACVIMQRLGLRTAMAACIGDDEYGRFCRQTLDHEGVNHANVQTLDQRQTGVTISLAYPDDRLLLTNTGTMTALKAADITDDMLARTKHIHVGSFFIQTGLQPGLAELFARAQNLGISTSLDTGWDPEENWMNPVLKAVFAHTDVFLPNQTEFAHVTGTTDRAAGFKTLHEWGVGEVVLKCGSQGAHYSGPDGIFSHPGFFAAPIDTTGAGDSCNAGYIAARIEGQTPRDRLAFGNACGALTVAAIGGTTGVTSRAAVEKRLAE